MIREARGKTTGLAERARRLRRRAEVLAAILVLFSMPLLWSLSQQVRPTPINALAQPVTRAGPLPQAPGPAQTAATQTDVARTDAAARTSRGESVEVAHEGPPTKGCDDPRVLVDRTHALPADYAPANLVSLRRLGVPVLGRDALLRREAAENLEHLVASAAAVGEELTVASAYRSYADQRASHARLVSVYGRRADKVSASPGHSQHQLGTAVDFTNAAVGYEVRRGFGYTGASRWLAAHAHEYGFVLAYPLDGEAKTGYGWEPWHYRYVGTDVARRIRESKLGLQGFLLREGVLPRC